MARGTTAVSTTFCDRGPAAPGRAHRRAGRGPDALPGGAGSASSRRTSWPTEGLIDLDRFSLMFGIFGLAECVDVLMARDGLDGRLRPRRACQRASYRITQRVAELVAARPLPLLRRRQRLRLPAQPERHRPRPGHHRRHAVADRRRAGAARAHRGRRPAPRPVRRRVSPTSSTSRRPCRPTRRPMVDVIRGALPRRRCATSRSTSTPMVHPDHRLPGAQERPRGHRGARLTPLQRLPRGHGRDQRTPSPPAR